MNIEKRLLTNCEEFSSVRISPEYIVVHYTANEDVGANEDAHYSYFNRAKYYGNGNRFYANAHYLVGNGKVLQILEDTWEGWHSGSKAMNLKSIGIEMCVNRDYDFSITRKKTIELVAYLMKRYGIGIDNVIRHYDVTGKICPAMYCNSSANNQAWQQFKNEVMQVYDGSQNVNNQSSTITGVVIAESGLNVRTGRGTDYAIVKALSYGSTINIYEEKDGWYRIDGGWVCSKYVSSGTSKSTGTVTCKIGLNVRAGAGTGYGVVKALPYGTEINIYGESSGWIRTDGGWVCAKYVSR